MRGLQSISSLFGNEFNKFNNAGAGLSYDPKTTLKSCGFFFRENATIWPYIRDVLRASIRNVTKICKPLVVYRF